MGFLIEQIMYAHDQLGEKLFISLSVIVSGLLCFAAIPFTTDLMVNHAAGISGRWFGSKCRTLVINASTNNPELASMLVAMAIGRMGGFANPVGSLFANCYLMYVVAPLWVILILGIKKGKSGVSQFISLFKKEKKLIAWHIGISLLAVACGNLALWLLGDRALEKHNSGNGITLIHISHGDTPVDLLTPNTGFVMWLALAVLITGLGIIMLLESRLKKARPNLFTDIHDASHGYSILAFLIGTTGLIASCWLMNAMFFAWSELYRESLSAVLGVAVFAGLHYILGALITSLPELRVAISNYCRLTVPDFNTALGSASYSNLTNLIICILGLIIFVVLSLFNITIPW